MAEHQNDDTVYSVSTEELLSGLASYGVDRERLKYECRHGYLPHPKTETHETGLGRSGKYQALTLVRAKRLYRLRRLDADPRAIRFLLFLRDGWGWQELRNDVLASAEKTLGQSLNGVKRYSTKNGLDEAAIENIVEHQHNALLRALDDPTADVKPTSTEMTRFYVGVLETGLPLEKGSARRLVGPMNSLFWPGIGKFENWILCHVFDFLIGLLDVRAERLMERLANASDAQIERSRKSFLHHHRLIRYVMRRAAQPNAKGIFFSLLTMGGQAKKIRESEPSDSRMNLHQMLLGSFGIFVGIEIAFEEFVDRWTPMLPILIKSLFVGKQPSAEP